VVAALVCTACLDPSTLVTVTPDGTINKPIVKIEFR
jgi:hypothetical protein